jgi:hypothetical protein
MELEIIVLNQKNKYSFSHMRNLDFKNSVEAEGGLFGRGEGSRIGGDRLKYIVYKKENIIFCTTNYKRIHLHLPPRLRIILNK